MEPNNIIKRPIFLTEKEMLILINALKSGYAREDYTDIINNLLEAARKIHKDLITTYSAEENGIIGEYAIYFNRGTNQETEQFKAGFMAGMKYGTDQLVIFNEYMRKYLEDINKLKFNTII